MIDPSMASSYRRELASASEWPSSAKMSWAMKYDDDDDNDPQKDSLDTFCPFWRVYTENPGFKSISWDWEALTVAGDTLEPVKVKDAAGVWKLVLKKRRDIDLKDSPITTTAIAQLRSLLFRAIRQRPFTSIRSKKKTQMLTDSDINSFHIFLEKARYDWKLYNIYASEISDIVEHDSTIDGVMEKVPDHIMKAVPEHHSRIRMLVDVVRDWRKAELHYQFALFLLECQGIEEYLNCMSRGEHLGREPKIWFQKMSKSGLRRNHEFYLEVVDGVLRGSWCPIHFLVYQERSMDYKIRHPLVELAKLWVYFYRFDLKTELFGWSSRIKYDVFDDEPTDSRGKKKGKRERDTDDYDDYEDRIALEKMRHDRLHN